jgi:hypothetical protein
VTSESPAKDLKSHPHFTSPRLTSFHCASMISLFLKIPNAQLTNHYS